LHHILYYYKYKYFVESFQEAEEKAAKSMISSDLSPTEENTMINDNMIKKKKLFKDVFTEKEKYQP